MSRRDVQDSIDKRSAAVLALEADAKLLMNALEKIEAFAAGTVPGTAATDHIAGLAHIALQAVQSRHLHLRRGK